MKELPEAEIRKTKPLPLVWVVPLVALVVGSYVIYRDVAENGPVIEIEFQDGSGIEAGRTSLRYKGIVVGTVESVALSDGLESVRVSVALLKSAKELARDGSVFWILRPEIGIEGVRGLGNLISGPSIEARPGGGGPEKRFVGLEKSPRAQALGGVSFFVRSANLGSLKPGSPVLYRQVAVGEVVETMLAPDARTVLSRVHVNAPYDRLVRMDTVFWNASGVEMKVGLLGAKIHTNSLESMLAGGLVFATPEPGKDESELAAEGTVFDLQTEQRDEWLKWSPSIALE